MDSIMDASRDLQEKFWDVQMVAFKNPGVDVTEKKKELLKEFTDKILTDYLRALQKRLVKNGNQHFIVGDSVTLADFDNAHIAYTYIFNEANEFYKELSEVLGHEEFKDINAYYKGLHDVVFKEYFETKRKDITRPY